MPSKAYKRWSSFIDYFLDPLGFFITLAVIGVIHVAIGMYDEVSNYLLDVLVVHFFCAFIKTFKENR